jgi:hypothetical protein
MSRRARQRFDRRVILNPIAVAIESARKLSEADRATLLRIIDTAWTHYRSGVECGAQWCVLADALNMAESLARIGIASDADSVERIDAAQRVLAQAHMRHTERGTWALRGPELQALDAGLWTHRVQLEHCSLGEFERAKHSTEVRIRQARAGNAPAGAIIVEGAIA